MNKLDQEYIKLYSRYDNSELVVQVEKEMKFSNKPQTKLVKEIIKFFDRTSQLSEKQRNVLIKYLASEDSYYVSDNDYFDQYNG